MKISVGTSYKLRIADCGLRTLQLRIADCGLRIEEHSTKQPATISKTSQDGKSAIRNPQSAIIIAICLFIFTGCGKIGEPLPPIPRAPLIVDELRVEQQGTQLRLSFPFTRTPRSVRLQRIDIYRLAETVNDPPGVTQESFSSRANV